MTARLCCLCCVLLPLGMLAAVAGADEFQHHLTAGQAFYNHSKHDQAIREFKETVKLQPNSSMAHLWLARALGRKAEKSNPLRAAFLVGDIRREFERAVELDPNNVEARSDLLQFYLDAPGAFGGGLDKARRQAEAIERLNKAEGHSARARIAVKEKRYNAAELEYRAAVEADPKHPGYQRDLAEFLKKYKSHAQGSKTKGQGLTPDT